MAEGAKKNVLGLPLFLFVSKGKIINPVVTALVRGSQVGWIVTKSESKRSLQFQKPPDSFVEVWQDGQILERREGARKYHQTAARGTHTSVLSSAARPGAKAPRGQIGWLSLVSPPPRVCRRIAK